MDRLSKSKNFPNGTKKTHPCLFAMLLDRGGDLTPRNVEKLNLVGIDLGAITKIGDLQHKRSLNVNGTS